jgi:hypothetical protein
VTRDAANDVTRRLAPRPDLPSSGALISGNDEVAGSDEASEALPRSPTMSLFWLNLYTWIGSNHQMNDHILFLALISAHVKKIQKTKKEKKYRSGPLR